jgi:hypothetical protein
MTGGTEQLLTVAQELAEVSRLVEDDDVPGALGRFVERVVRTVPECVAATITVSGAQRAEVVAVFAMPGLTEPEVGVQEGKGPVVEALRYHEPRHVEDTRDDQRWPRTSARLASQRYRSCLVLPVPTRRGEAALTLLSREPHRFNDTVHDVVLLLTMHTGVVFDNAQLFHDNRRLVEQLNMALATRRVIGQAEGLLMREFGCTAEQGFRLLKGASQNTNTKLRDVASALVSAHKENSFVGALTKFGLDAGAGSATS